MGPNLLFAFLVARFMICDWSSVVWLDLRIKLCTLSSAGSPFGSPFGIMGVALNISSATCFDACQAQIGYCFFSRVAVSGSGFTHQIGAELARSDRLALLGLWGAFVGAGANLGEVSAGTGQSANQRGGMKCKASFTGRKRNLEVYVRSREEIIAVCYRSTCAWSSRVCRCWGRPAPARPC